MDLEISVELGSTQMFRAHRTKQNLENFMSIGCLHRGFWLGLFPGHSRLFVTFSKVSFGLMIFHSFAHTKGEQKINIL